MGIYYNFELTWALISHLAEYLAHFTIIIEPTVLLSNLSSSASLRTIGANLIAAHVMYYANTLG